MLTTRLIALVGREAAAMRFLSLIFSCYTIPGLLTGKWLHMQFWRQGNVETAMQNI
jgi:hypothetical protein